jgi:hypothetical protein
MLFVELIVVLLRKIHSYMDGPLIIKNKNKILFIFIPSKIKQLKRKYVMEIYINFPALLIFCWICYVKYKKNIIFMHF